MQRVLIAALLSPVIGLVTVASAEDDLTSLSYISYLERYATVQPASQEDSLEAVINMPLVAGDRIDTAREARVEVQLADGGTLWMDEYTSVSFDAVAYSRDSQGDRTVLYLAEGTILVEIPYHTLTRQPTRVDGPGGTVYLNQPGLYRVGTRSDGAVRVEVWSGTAEAASSSGGVLVAAESAAEVSGGTVSALESRLSVDDPFAIWVEQRRRVVTGESAKHVDMRYSSEAAQLDNYGQWVYLENQNTWGWQPSVSSSWTPYTAGRWYWTPVGWSWLSYEPWGWLPYHYGSWNFHVSFGWCWSWGRSWSPAWVRWCHWPGYVGWSPCGYTDWWYWRHYGGYHGYRPVPRDQPPRRRVVPQAQHRPVPSAEQVSPTRVALDVKGGARIGEIDPTAWTVVRADDFSSPHLARIAQPGVQVFPEHDDATGVIRTAPLVTASPSVEAPHAGIERVFGSARTAEMIDVTPVLAHSDALRPERAVQLVEPTTSSSLSRRGITVTAPSATAPSATAPRTRTAVGGATLSTGAGQPGQRALTPNVHRSALRTTTGGTGTRALSPVRPRTGTVGLSPSQPRSGRGAGPVLRGGNLSGTPVVASPTAGTRSTVPRSGSIAGDRGTSSGPVIVPRTAPIRSYRPSTGSTRVGGSAPSRSPSVRRYTSPSRPSARSVSPRTSGSVSRSSPTRVSRPRSSSSVSRSSGARSSGSRSGGSSGSASSARSSGGRRR
jgi:hypothetical protein